jgi:hypothetical protein
MVNEDCRAIEELWIKLNPHCQVHGCEVDAAGTVRIYILYSRNKKQHPLELCLGNPPRTVIRGLRQAITEEARAKRLSQATGFSVISEAGGISIAGEKGERDK